MKRVFGGRNRQYADSPPLRVALGARREAWPRRLRLGLAVVHPPDFGRELLCRRLRHWPRGRARPEESVAGWAGRLCRMPGRALGIADGDARRS